MTKSLSIKEQVEEFKEKVFIRSKTHEGIELGINADSPESLVEWFTQALKDRDKLASEEERARIEKAVMQGIQPEEITCDEEDIECRIEKARAQGNNSFARQLLSIIHPQG